MSVPFSPHPHQYLLFLVFLKLVILTAVGEFSLWVWFTFLWYLVLWASFHVSVDHLSSLGKCLFRCSTQHFLIRWKCLFFNVELYEFLYILHINSLSDLSFSNIFSHSKQSFVLSSLDSCRPSLFIFDFVSLAHGEYC